MVPAQPVVLVTRPAAEAHDTAQRLRALGWQPLIAPVLQVRRRPLRLAEAVRLQAVLVTSGNALPSLPARLHGMTLLAVGDATAARARAAGFSNVESARRDADALAVLAMERCTPAAEPLLLASGSGQGHDLAVRLRQAGFRVVHRVAYAARPVSRLPAAARTALDGDRVGAALFFSPASAQAFVSALGRDGGEKCLRAVWAVAISAATADVLSPLPWRDIRVASRPNQDELLACLR